MRRICRELQPKLSAISSRPAPFIEHALVDAASDEVGDTTSVVYRGVAGRQLGRHRRHGRNDAFSAAAAEVKKRQFVAFGVFAVHTGRQ